MPSLNIASVQLSFRYCSGPRRVQSFVDGKALSCFAFRHDKGLSSIWRLFLYPEKHNLGNGNCEKSCGSFKIKAVATFEPRYDVEVKENVNGHHMLESPAVDSAPSGVHIDSPTEDSNEPDEREKLRRMRISKANKGNTPWNKGRKHSPETLQKIRERTKLAMQNPKVKGKLMNLGHSQSVETRKKIGVGVRLGWQRRREKLMVQETCLLDWQNLIAESAKAGLIGEEELQWDSHQILKKQLQQEWLGSIELRKVTKQKGNRRAPKSLEQRRKIAEAIAAKWADPEYRQRVTIGLAKYHGIQDGKERKARNRPPGEPRGEPRFPKPPRKKVIESDCSSRNVTKMKSQLPKFRRKAPAYKDPFANTKLEMIKNIRAERAASEVKKHEEALARAKLLIAEAEKAAEALEAAAKMSPIAQASLIETRKLIAEAIKSIQSIEKPPFMPHDNNDSSIVPTEQKKEIGIEKQMDTDTEYSSSYQEQQKKVNGSHVLKKSENHKSDLDLHAQLIRMQYHGLNNCSSSDSIPLSNIINGRYGHKDFPAAVGLDLNSLVEISDPEELSSEFMTDYNGVHCSVRNGSFLQASTSNGVPAPNGSVVLSSHAVPALNGTVMHVISGVEVASSYGIMVRTSSRVGMEKHTKSLTKKWVRGRLVEVIEGS